MIYGKIDGSPCYICGKRASITYHEHSMCYDCAKAAAREIKRAALSVGAPKTAMEQVSPQV